jgi:hypothetical protein
MPRLRERNLHIGVECLVGLKRSTWTYSRWDAADRMYNAACYR